MCQDLRQLKDETSHMWLEETAVEQNYKAVEMYKTQDCTGVAYVDGIVMG